MAKRPFDVFGRYDWSDKLAVEDEQARAELGNNSNGGGVGIKFTFQGLGRREPRNPVPLRPPAFGNLVTCQTSLVTLALAKLVRGSRHG